MSSIFDLLLYKKQILAINTFSSCIALVRTIALRNPTALNRAVQAVG